MKTRTFNPQVGDHVAVCYDGKVARATRGIVQEVDAEQDRILVRFHLYATQSPVEVEHWFPRDSESYYEAYGGEVPSEHSLMEKMFGMEGDWYSVYSEREDVVQKILAAKQNKQEQS
jgi:hypothetical protein